MIQFQYIDGFCKYTENDESHESKYIQAIELEVSKFQRIWKIYQCSMLSILHFMCATSCVSV